MITIKDKYILSLGADTESLGYIFRLAYADKINERICKTDTFVPRPVVVDEKEKPVKMYSLKYFRQIKNRSIKTMELYIDGEI
jgi:hypothetical protein